MTIDLGTVDHAQPTKEMHRKMWRNDGVEQIPQQKQNLLLNVRARRFVR